MKDKLMFLCGILCASIGVALFLMNTTISSLGFYRFGRVNTGGILIVFLIMSVIYLIAKRNKTGIILLASVITLMLLSLIMGIHMYVNHMSALDLILIVGMIAVGIGLMVRSLLQK